MALRDDLTAALRTAMRERDRPVAAALRNALAELANAEAVPPAPDGPDATGGAATGGSEHVAGGVHGVGAAEAARRIVSESEARGLVAEQRSELAEHAARLTQLCRHDEADSARRALGVLDEVLAAQA